MYQAERKRGVPVTFREYKRYLLRIPVNDDLTVERQTHRREGGEASVEVAFRWQRCQQSATADRRRDRQTEDL